LHFPKELGYGYLWFEGDGRVPLGRQGEGSLKGGAYREGWQNVLSLLVRFEHTTSGLSERSLRPFCHSATWEERVEIKSQVCMYDQYYVILIRWQKII
jgi:hypothetical protein